MGICGQELVTFAATLAYGWLFNAECGQSQLANGLEHLILSLSLSTLPCYLAGGRHRQTAPYGLGKPAKTPARLCQDAAECAPVPGTPPVRLLPSKALVSGHQPARGQR